MIHTTPTKVLLATTLRPLVVQLSGSLAQGVRLLDQCLHDEPTPQKMAAFEWEISALLREVGRRIMAWVLTHLEPEHTAEAPARVQFEGRVYRRRAKQRSAIATLFGTVNVRRRLYEPLARGGHAIHPLELQVGVEAGLATPALAERVGQWAADHTQRQVLAMLAGDHDVHWSCTSLRKVLASLSTGMATQRHVSQVEQVVHWLAQAQASRGRYRPTLSVGRDGIFVPLQHKVWQEGSTATVSVLDRRGKRLGTVYLGHMPESGQGTLTTQLTALLKAILSQVDSAGLRLVYVTDDGYHPSDYYHSVLQTMPDPRRPWRLLEWRRIIDYYHACQYVQQLADVIFGPGTESQCWAKRMREQLKTRAAGVARVLQSAATLRHRRGLRGQTKVYEHAYAYLKKRSRWMCYQAYRREHLPIGSGITEAACKIVFTQRLKRSGMAWTRAGGQVILDLRVIWLSGVWEAVHQRYLASKPLPVPHGQMVKDTQPEQQAA
ncbi:MAG TPA: hypothetical protein VI542_07325 [Candidatus Tectomicrobia bacterium]